MLVCCLAGWMRDVVCACACGGRVREHLRDGPVGVRKIKILKENFAVSCREVRDLPHIDVGLTLYVALAGAPREAKVPGETVLNMGGATHGGPGRDVPLAREMALPPQVVVGGGCLLRSLGRWPRSAIAGICSHSLLYHAFGYVCLLPRFWRGLRKSSHLSSVLQ